jgi:hypothetical protein
VEHYWLGLLWLRLRHNEWRLVSSSKSFAESTIGSVDGYIGGRSNRIGLGYSSRCATRYIPLNFPDRENPSVTIRHSCLKSLRLPAEDFLELRNCALIGFGNKRFALTGATRAPPGALSEGFLLATFYVYAPAVLSTVYRDALHFIFVFAHNLISFCGQMPLVKLKIKCPGDCLVEKGGKRLESPELLCGAQAAGMPHGYEACGNVDLLDGNTSESNVTLSFSDYPGVNELLHGTLSPQTSKPEVDSFL